MYRYKLDKQYFSNLKKEDNFAKSKLSDLCIGRNPFWSFGCKDSVNRPTVAIEIDFFDKNRKCEDFRLRFKKALDSCAHLVCVRFNLDENMYDKEIAYVENEVRVTLRGVDKPLILLGSNNDNVDIKLLPLLCEKIGHPCIISFGNENTVEKIAIYASKYDHILSLKSAIDINMAKELNIIAIQQAGMSADRILIDTDLGGLGYGLEYGYSMMEKVKLAGLDGDDMLKMPLIAFVGDEVVKAKEVKSNLFDDNWGEVGKRDHLWQTCAAVSVIMAGVDLVVVRNFLTVQSLLEVFYV